MFLKKQNLKNKIALVTGAGKGIGKAGEVISNSLEVACGKNQSIKIIEIQRQGKNPQKIGEFVLGSKISKGAIISYV